MLRSLDLHILIDDLLYSIYKVTSDLFHTLNFVILHDNVFTPREELIVYYFPSWAQSEHSMVCLTTNCPVRSTDSYEGKSFLAEVSWVQTLFACLFEFAVKHFHHTCIMSRSHTVCDGMI